MGPKSFARASTAMTSTRSDDEDPSDTELEGGSKPKRRRRSRACLECRALKIACVPVEDGRELCQRCEKNGFRCVYTSNHRGRKPRPKVFPLEAQQTSVNPQTTDSTLRAGPSQVATNPQPSTSSAPAALRNNGNNNDQGVPSVIHSTVIPADMQEAMDDEEVGASDNSSDSPKLRRGPTFTFLNQADDASRPQSRVHSPALPEPSSRKTVQASTTKGKKQSDRRGTYSIRDMLRPVGPISKDYLPEPDFPKPKSGGDPAEEDPLSKGYVSERVARLLFEYFYHHLNTWSGILDPEVDTHDSIRQRSPFLYTAILAVSSLHNQQHIRLPIIPVSNPNNSSAADRVYMQPLAYQQISILAINHATSAFVDGYSSLEVVQAFYILSTWKSPDDSISYLRIGYAAKLAMDLDLGRKQSPHRNADAALQAKIDRQWRSRQRMWMALFVQDRVQGFQFFNSFMLPLNDPLISDCATWHLHAQAQPSDVFLVASVHCRRIQSYFRDQISTIISSTASDHVDPAVNVDRSRSRRLMLELLIPMLQNALKEWYVRWELEVKRVRGYDASVDAEKSKVDEGLRIMRVWQLSIQLHLCSFALSDSLDQPQTGGDHDPERAILGVVALWPVIEGARGILQEFAKLPADRLRSAPDTISVLPDLAAVCLWRLSRLSASVSQTNDYMNVTLALVSGVVKNFRDAMIDRTDGVLLHARFLLSVATRMRKALAKRTTQAAPKADLPSTQVPIEAPLVPPNFDQWMLSNQNPMLSQPQQPFIPSFGDPLAGIFNQPDMFAQQSPVNSVPSVSDNLFADWGFMQDNTVPSQPFTEMPFGADTVNNRQDNPLTAFAMDMDLMAMLSGSMFAGPAEETLGM